MNLLLLVCLAGCGGLLFSFEPVFVDQISTLEDENVHEEKNEMGFRLGRCQLLNLTNKG